MAHVLMDLNGWAVNLPYIISIHHKPSLYMREEALNTGLLQQFVGYSHEADVSELQYSSDVMTDLSCLVICFRVPKMTGHFFSNS
jgi:hypothetical protein